PCEQGQPVRIVDQVKRRDAVTTVEPSLERDLAADPGRLAHRYGERKRHLAQTLTSTKAVRRRSLIYLRARVSRRCRVSVSPISSRDGTVGALGAAAFSQTIMTPTPFF